MLSDITRCVPSFLELQIISKNCCCCEELNSPLKASALKATRRHNLNSELGSVRFPNATADIASETKNFGLGFCCVFSSTCGQSAT